MDAYRYGGISQGSSSGEIMWAIIVLAIIFIVTFAADYIFGLMTRSGQRFTTLLEDTAYSKDMPITIHQDPLKYSDARPILPSMNERTGIEFAYSFYICALSSSFDGDFDGLTHVFHKGFQSPWPLMGPGVFMKANTNTMRIYMNTYKDPYMYTDIENFPVDKWVHVVLNCYKSALDIFINGNIAKRIPFEDTIPYQNFQDLQLFRPNKGTITIDSSTTMTLNGVFDGYLSKLIYARYALSVTEIQALMAAGPAAIVRPKSRDTPPYMSDDWWAHQ
jgi:hypothetical protein